MTAPTIVATSLLMRGPRRRCRLGSRNSGFSRSAVSLCCADMAEYSNSTKPAQECFGNSSAPWPISIADQTSRSVPADGCGCALLDMSERIYRRFLSGQAHDPCQCVISATLLEWMASSSDRSYQRCDCCRGCNERARLAESPNQPTWPSRSRRSTTPGSAPVWVAFSTTIVPLTITVVRVPVGYWCGSA